MSAARLVLRWSLPQGRTLRWALALRAGRARAVARLDDQPLRRCTLRVDRADGLIHLDSGLDSGGGLLSITLTDEPAPRVLYARTSLLADLQLRGGTYRFENCATASPAPEPGRATLARRHVSSS